MLALVASGMVSAVLLAACASTSDADRSAPSNSVQTSPAPNATQGPSSSTATILQFDAIGVRLLDSSGEELLAVGYLDEPAALIAQLSAAFGHGPVITSVAGSGDLSAATEYDWDGFVLSDEDIAITRTFFVTATAPAIGDIDIRTTEGFVVGMTEADLVASGATLYASADLRTYKAGSQPVAAMSELPPGEAPEAWMYIGVPADGTQVTSISGPVSNAAG